ncbi:hypothetical protein ACJX0J_016105, partial [Zea mays]
MQGLAERVRPSELMHQRRLVRPSEGKLRYVVIHEVPNGPAANEKPTPQVCMFTLFSQDGQHYWVHEYTVSFADIWSNDFLAVMPWGEVPSLTLVDPESPNILYFFQDTTLYIVDERARLVVRRLEGCLIDFDNRELRFQTSRFIDVWELPPKLRLLNLIPCTHKSLPIFKRRLLGDLLDFSARELQVQMDSANRINERCLELQKNKKSTKTKFEDDKRKVRPAKRSCGCPTILSRHMRVKYLQRFLHNSLPGSYGTLHCYATDMLAVASNLLVAVTWMINVVTARTFDAIPPEIGISRNSGSKKTKEEEGARRKAGAVKISPWTLARLNAEEVSKAAAEARKKSKILKPVGKHGAPENSSKPDHLPTDKRRLDRRGFPAELSLDPLATLSASGTESNYSDAATEICGSLAPLQLEARSAFQPSTAA